MFGLNKKLKQASKKPIKKTNGKPGVISSITSKKKSSITAIPDLICKVNILIFSKKKTTHTN